MSDDTRGTDVSDNALQPASACDPAPDMSAPSTGGRVGAEATSLLVDFATGGIVGLLRGMDEAGDFEDEVDDPEALHRAEEAVKGDRPIPVDGQSPIDETWTTVAVQDGMGGTTPLQLLASALEEAGVPYGWDPYAPGEGAGFTWPGTETRVYRIQVPDSRVAAARAALPDRPPEGVRYDWSAGSPRLLEDETAPDDFAAPAGANAPGDADDGFTFPEPAGDSVGATAVTGYGGSTLSDNDRLQRMASGGGPSALRAVIVAVVLVLVAIALFILLRG